MPCIHLAVERKGLKFRTCESITGHIWGSILGHPVHLLGIKEHLCKFTSVTCTAGVKRITKVLGPPVSHSVHLPQNGLRFKNGWP